MNDERLSSSPCPWPPLEGKGWLSRWGGLVTVAIFAVLLAACGRDSSPAVDVRPVAQILDGGIRVEEITAAGAAVRVTTLVPVVCSVVYGTDTAYGQLSTDPDMGGTAHSDHAAPLRGLEPDTLYHFRVQGTGEDGTLYMSEDMTFRTPPEKTEPPASKTNLASPAQGATIIGASSAYGGARAGAPANAIDADPSTEWSSNGDGDAAFITVQLVGESHLSAVGLWSRTMGVSAEIRRFRVVTDRGDVLGPFDLPDALQLYTFDVDVVAGWLRFEVVSSSGGNTGAVELAAYGERLAGE